MLSITAGGLSLVALVAVYRSWRAQVSRYLYLGIVFWLVSTVCWSYAQGWEFGLLYALCIPALLVWPFIAFNQVQLPQPKNVPQPRRFDFSRGAVIANVTNHLVVMVILLVISVLITLGVCALLPFTIAGKLATATILLPVLWGLIVYHYLASSYKFKVVGIYAVLAALCLPILAFLPM